jgi:hypothetical protein
MKMTVDDLVEALEQLSERDWQRVAGRFGAGATGDGSGDGRGPDRRAIEDRPAPSPRRLHPPRIRFRKTAGTLVVKISLWTN